jgi:hypothetical protein
MGLDLTGATPSVGQGIVFAINPCREEFHFGFVGEWRTRSGCSAVLGASAELGVPHEPAAASCCVFACVYACRRSAAASPLQHRLANINQHRQRLPLAAGLSTPAINISPLGIKVSAQPIGLSVSNKGEIPSDHSAIGMTDPFWVGINKPSENRVVTQGNIYITGSITVEPIVQQSDKVVFGLVGDGKVGVACSRGNKRWLQQGCLPGGRAFVTCCALAWLAALWHGVCLRHGTVINCLLITLPP